MALTTASAIRASWLDADATTHDTRITVLIGQATGIMEGICKQPLDPVSVERISQGNGGTLYMLPYTSPVTLTTLKYKNELDDAAWTAVTGAVVVKIDGVQYVYLGDGFTQPWYQFTLSVGYSSVPNDLANICSEMVVELFKMTDYNRSDSRFGIQSLAGGEGGVTSTTVYRDLASRFERKLSPYKLRAWL